MMLFDSIPLAAGGSDFADPRAAMPSPAGVMGLPSRLPGSGAPPNRLIVALEGTATQQVSVELFICDEATNQWYSLGASTQVTVGKTAILAAFPGKLYIRATSLPAAAATLKVAGAYGQ